MSLFLFFPSSLDELLHLICSSGTFAHRVRRTGSSSVEDQCGMIHGMRYCCAMTSNPSKDARRRLWRIVLRTIKPSLPTKSVVETPVVTFCGETILPITAPDELVAAMSTGLRPSR
jgi:hypothetical protein